MANDEEKQITLTLTNLSGGAAESIVVSPTSTTLEELVGLATAFGLVAASSSGDSNSSSGNGGVTLTVDGRVVYHGGSEGSKKVGEAGIGDGDMVLVGRAGRGAAGGGAQARRTATQQQQQQVAGGTGAQTSAGGGGTLDFSALLAGAGSAAPAPAAAAAAQQHHHPPPAAVRPAYRSTWPDWRRPPSPPPPPPPTPPRPPLPSSGRACPSMMPCGKIPTQVSSFLSSYHQIIPT